MNNIHFCFEQYDDKAIPYSKIIDSMIEGLSNEETSCSTISLNLRNRAWCSNSLSSIIFLVYCFFKFTFLKKTILIIPSTPPVLLLFIATICKYSPLSSYKTVFHAQDIHPEAAALAGLNKNSTFYKTLVKLDIYSLERTDLIITLTEGMKKILSSKTSSTRIDVIENHVEIPKEALPHCLQKSKYRNTEKGVKIIYAGNVGAFQDIETIALCIANTKTNITLDVYGSGSNLEAAKEKLANHPNKGRITFHSPVSMIDLLPILDSCDYGLVSLTEGMANLASPSKAQIYLNRNLPILLIADMGCGLDEQISDYDLGIAIDRAGKTEEQITEELESLTKPEMNSTCIDYYNKYLGCDIFQEIINESMYDLTQT